MPEIELRRQAVGPWPMNSYVLVCPETKQSILIDPGADPDRLVEMLGDSQPVAIVLTHTHPDHVGALDEMEKRLNVPLLAHPGPHFNDMELDITRALHDGDTVQVGNHTLRVSHTPGHIADQLCLSIEEDHRVVVGDTVFEGGPGKTWSPEQFHTTLRTLRQVVLKWPDETICFPGHGPEFRLGDKRQKIAAFVEKEHGDFFGDAAWEM